MNEYIEIDGAYGEGGGQILRSSLTLSMHTQKPLRITNIRAKRSKPGLMRQHLTAVNAAVEVCGAEVQGNNVGSTELTFIPGKVKGGEYEFSVGTAGSTTLVFQTVMPVLLTADEPSTIVVNGGTHNPMAPPYNFLARSYIPMVNKMGPLVQTELLKPGFFPAGAGSFKAVIEPSSELKKFTMTDRGKSIHKKAIVLISNLAKHIGEREIKALKSKLNWDDKCFWMEDVKNAVGPGNIVFLELKFENITEVITSFGEVSTPAEGVASKAVEQYKKFITTSAPVGEHLTDQLMLLCALAGKGKFISSRISNHAKTHIHLIQSFLDCKVILDGSIESGTLVSIC